MNKFYYLLIAAILTGSIACAEVPSKEMKIRIVNFKHCVERSKLGRQEQAAFEALKKQMENVLVDKEKVLNEIGNKFENPDYLDSLSPQAENEMKQKVRALSQEFAQLQNQYMQALQQTNLKVVQRLTDAVMQASSNVAKRDGLNLVLSEEATFFVAPDLDISSQIIAVMDQTFDREPQESKSVVPQFKLDQKSDQIKR